MYVFYGFPGFSKKHSNEVEKRTELWSIRVISYGELFNFMETVLDSFCCAYIQRVHQFSSGDYRAVCKRGCGSTVFLLWRCFESHYVWAKFSSPLLTRPPSSSFSARVQKIRTSLADRSISSRQKLVNALYITEFVLVQMCVCVRGAACMCDCVRGSAGMCVWVLYFCQWVQMLC